MEENILIDTFHSEVVTDEDEEDDWDDINPLLQPQSPGRRQRRDGRESGLRTRVVHKMFQSPGASGGRGWRCLFVLLVVVLCLGLGLYLNTQVQSSPDSPALKPSTDYLDFRQPENLVSFEEIMESNFTFNLSSKTDVMVFLHIQKTGGTTFGKHLVSDIDLARPCECHGRSERRKSGRKFHCSCLRPGTKGEASQWLFSRYSTGWKCGLHPDWTELTGCVDQYMADTEGSRADRRYFYITFLRDPVRRYISEWKHVARGAPWSSALLSCGGKIWADILPLCYQEEDWSGVTMEQFINCSDNLAINRQTRMLADLELVNCHNTTGMEKHKRDLIILNSAKANLANMAYFGLTEEQSLSQYLFEETFNLRFKTDFDQLNKEETHSGASLDNLDKETIDKIRDLNHLDVELYKFASDLLHERFDVIKASDESYQEHISNIGKEKYEFSWSDIEDEN